MKQSGGATSVNRIGPAVFGDSRRSIRWLRRLGWLGVMLAAPLFFWLPLTIFTPLSSMIDVFGISGVRVQASTAQGDSFPVLQRRNQLTVTLFAAATPPTPVIPR